MKIVHLELAAFFTENTGYHTNMLVERNLWDGHETTVISTNYQWKESVIVQVSAAEQRITNGLLLIRLPYANPNPIFERQKFRRVIGLYRTLERLAPDVILCHGTQFWSILDVIRYKQAHPQVKFYADTHTAAYNSGTNWLSLHILHRLYYRWLVQKALPHLEKYFYVGEGEREFAVENYGVPEEMMEFYPLGGTIFSDREYAEKRQLRRAELGLEPGDLLFIHSGKMDALKRTQQLLRAFSAVPNPRFHMAVIGAIAKEQKEGIETLLAADSRIVWLGWKSGSELQEYLCACDVYCQPGSVSATMQNAVCCNCAIMAYPHAPYTKNLDFGNILWVKTQEDIEKVFCALADGKIDLETLKSNSARCAKELLDYRNLAARLYQ